MPRLRSTALLFLMLLPSLPALAGPRDAVAVLNRCGKPMKGDDTVLDDSVAGGHRVLRYERGDLHFDKVAMDGWTFTYGSHGKQSNLDADQMAVHMPCLKDALADSAEPGAIQPISSATRVEASVKREYRQLLLWSVVAIVVIGLVLLLLSRRRPAEPEDD